MSVFLDSRFDLEDLFNKKFDAFMSSSQPGSASGSRGGSSSGVHTLPKSSLSEEEEGGIPPPLSVDDSPLKRKGKTDSTSTKKRKGKKSKKKKVSKVSRTRAPCGSYDLIGKISDEVIQDVQQMQIEGLEINVAQSVCDDSRPQLGEEGKSYFLMRHNFSYPGPWSIMVAGPSALSSFGYRLSSEVVTRDDCVLVGTLQPNFRNVEGVWEQTWSKYLKTHMSFMAGKQQTQQMGPLGAVQLPTGVGQIDITPEPSSCARIKVDMMQKELSVSLHKSIIANRLSVGSKLSTSFDRKSNGLEYGAVMKSTDGKETIEAVAKPRHSLYSLFYTRKFGDTGSALTSRLSFSTATMMCQASFGYKYVFGKMNNQRMICGEISSDGYVRQTFTMPLLHNMLIKFFGEMNHFLKPQQLQRGELPHRFGAMIQIHM